MTIDEQILQAEIALVELRDKKQQLQIAEMFAKEQAAKPHGYLSYSYYNIVKNFSAGEMLLVSWFRAVYTHLRKEFDVDARIAFLSFQPLSAKTNKARWLALMNHQIATELSPQVELVFKEKK